MAAAGGRVKGTYPDIVERRLVGDVIEQEQGCRGRERSHRGRGAEGWVSRVGWGRAYPGHLGNKHG